MNDPDEPFPERLFFGIAACVGILVMLFFAVKVFVS